jgi:hypothetical protein
MPVCMTSLATSMNGRIAATAQVERLGAAAAAAPTSTATVPSTAAAVTISPATARAAWPDFVAAPDEALAYVWGDADSSLACVGARGQPTCGQCRGLEPPLLSSQRCRRGTRREGRRSESLPSSRRAPACLLRTKANHYSAARRSSLQSQRSDAHEPGWRLAMIAAVARPQQGRNCRHHHGQRTDPTTHPSSRFL